MDHKIKPTATRIGISSTWSTITYYNSLLEDKFIKTVVKKVLLKFKILTSEISIKKLSDYYIIVFCFFPLNFKKEDTYKKSYNSNSNSNTNSEPKSYQFNYRLFSFLKGILEQTLGKRIYFRAVRVPSFVSNSEILASWIQLKLKKKPKTHKTLIYKVLREWQITVVNPSTETSYQKSESLSESSSKN